MRERVLCAAGDSSNELQYEAARQRALERGMTVLARPEMSPGGRTGAVERAKGGGHDLLGPLEAGTLL